MFARVAAIFLFALFALPLLAVATPAPNNQPTVTVTVTAPATTITTVSQCNTGSIQCCNSVQSASDPATSLLLGLLGVVVQGVDVLIGVTCSPISVIGIGSNSCTADPVCCENDSFNGLIAIGCSPINL